MKINSHRQRSHAQQRRDQGATGRQREKKKASKMEHLFVGMDTSTKCIQETARKMLANSDKSQECVHSWVDGLRSSPANKRLPYLYIANDVMQQRHPGKLVFVHNFGKVLGKACDLFMQDPDTRRKLERVVTVWRDRQVLPKSIIAQLQNRLDGFLGA